MVRDIPDVVAPVKSAETTEDAEAEEDEGEQPILGHVSMATDLVRHVQILSQNLRISLRQDTFILAFQHRLTNRVLLFLPFM